MPTTKSRSRTTSSDSMSGQRAGDCPLSLECEEEELSAAQINFYNSKKKAFSDTMAKLEVMAKKGAILTTNSETGGVTMKVTESASSLGQVQPTQPVNSSQQQYRFVMDQRTGRIIGSIPGQSQGPVSTPRLTSPARVYSPASRGRGAIRQQIRPTSVLKRGHSPSPQPTPTPSKAPQVVDLTRGSDSGPTATIRKSFPALSVVAKPQRSAGAVQAKRSELDLKVKGLLVHTPAKFTEWLIQQGLVRSEQFDGKVKLKLGMYSDGKKFPHSGGYVWIQEGASNKYTSVFKGSLFEAGTGIQAPTVLLKLLYHWSCQTNIPNVASWVKVDNKQIDEFYTLLRSICVSAVQDEIIQMGGNDGNLEVGVISLGTTTADGQKREVRVEVLGVLDRATQRFRLRATEPIPGASQAERFSKIFDVMNVWAKTSSRIITDFSVDKDTLVRLGYKRVHQCSLSQAQAGKTENTNQQIMEYLKKVVPKMFQNTLSNLTTPVIQQFLDELTFREIFGSFPLKCFEGIIQRVSSQTAITASRDEAILSRLRQVAANPFSDWRYSVKSLETPALSRPSSRNSDRKSPSPVVKRASSVETEDSLTKKIKTGKLLVNLEGYYYASLPGEPSVLNSEFKADMAFKCHVCKKVFMNNLEFMKHLHLHVETDRDTAIDMADLSQCKFCYRDFDSEEKVNSHMDLEHFKKGQEFVCQICTNCFPVRNLLIHHMMKVHMKYEMPYQCQVCGFRCSLHRDMVEHFQLYHDRTDKLQCPLCLKTYSLYNDKGYNSSSSVSYLQHLQRHEDLKNRQSFNCKKCNLKFLEDRHVKSHLAEDHVSFKNFDNVEVYDYVATDEPIQMPQPDERNFKVATKKSASFKGLPQQSAFAAQNLEDLAIYDAQGERCCECGKNMTQAGHYLAYLCCTKCRYSSCCSKAMANHVQLFHNNAKLEYDLGKRSILPEEMYCVCGFSAHSGNKLAKHIATHGCQSAYPSLKEAERARNIPEGQEENFFIYSRDSGTHQKQQEEEGDGEKTVHDDPAVEENKTVTVSPNNDAAVEEDKMETENPREEEEVERNGDNTVEEGEVQSTDRNSGEEGGDDEDKQPGPGGLLFGTLFKYMGEKTEGEEDGAPSDGVPPPPSEVAQSEEKTEGETEKDNMETE